MFSIVTERLKLREFKESDYRDLFEILSDQETMKYYPAPFDQSGVESLIHRSISSYTENGFGLWAVLFKSENKFIGQCGISMQDIDGSIVPEIGYHINKKYWRNGFATEAARASLSFGFDKLKMKEIYIHTFVENIPSIGVAEKLKMEKVKEFNKFIKDHNIFMKHVVYSMNVEKYISIKSNLY